MQVHVAAGRSALGGFIGNVEPPLAADRILDVLDGVDVPEVGTSWYTLKRRTIRIFTSPGPGSRTKWCSTGSRRRSTSWSIWPPAVGVKLIVERPVQTIETNVGGTEHVLQAALRYGCPRGNRQHVGSLREGQQDSVLPRMTMSCSGRPAGAAGPMLPARWSTSFLGPRLWSRVRAPRGHPPAVQHRRPSSDWSIRDGHPPVHSSGSEWRPDHRLRRWDPESVLLRCGRCRPCDHWPRGTSGFARKGLQRRRDREHQHPGTRGAHPGSDGQRLGDRSSFLRGGVRARFRRYGSERTRHRSCVSAARVVPTSGRFREILQRAIDYARERATRREQV